MFEAHGPPERVHIGHVASGEVILTGPGDGDGHPARVFDILPIHPGRCAVLFDDGTPPRILGPWTTRFPRTGVVTDR